MNKRETLSTHTFGLWELRNADTNAPYVVVRLPENEGKRWMDPVVCILYEDVTPEDSVTIGAWFEACDNAVKNGRLIAAAPELLEALENLKAAVEHTPLGVRGIKAVQEAAHVIAKAKIE